MGARPTVMNDDNPHFPARAFLSGQTAPIRSTGTVCMVPAPVSVNPRRVRMHSDGIFRLRLRV